MWSSFRCDSSADCSGGWWEWWGGEQAEQEAGQLLFGDCWEGEGWDGRMVGEEGVWDQGSEDQADCEGVGRAGMMETIDILFTDFSDIKILGEKKVREVFRDKFFAGDRILPSVNDLSSMLHKQGLKIKSLEIGFIR